MFCLPIHGSLGSHYEIETEKVILDPQNQTNNLYRLINKEETTLLYVRSPSLQDAKFYTDVDTWILYMFIRVSAHEAPKLVCLPTMERITEH